MNDLNKRHEVLNDSLIGFIAKTDVENADSKKRSLNYLEWLEKKTELVKQEGIFSVSKDIDAKIRRGAVIWVEFGFNLGREFGGRHPALILRRTGDSVFVLPLSSQQPLEAKKHHRKIEKVYGFSNMVRWCNILKIENVSLMRVDIAAAIGNVKGHVLDDINVALRENSLY